MIGRNASARKYTGQEISRAMHLRDGKHPGFARWIQSLAPRPPKSRALYDGESVDARQVTQARASILVVDDDKTVLTTSLRIAPRSRIRGDSAVGGEEALRLIARGVEIDLVLADFTMPEMTGVELAKRSTSHIPRCRVLPVTSYGNREVLKDFDEARILQKPYIEDELTEKITRALN